MIAVVCLWDALNQDKPLRNHIIGTSGSFWTKQSTWSTCGQNDLLRAWIACRVVLTTLGLGRLGRCRRYRGCGAWNLSKALGSVNEARIPGFKTLAMTCWKLTTMDTERTYCSALGV